MLIISLQVLRKRMTPNQLNTTTNQMDTYQMAVNNTVKTLVTVAVCFVICWSNDQVFYAMYNLGYPVDWNGTYYKFIILMVFLNSTINPLVYFIKYRDYQMALKFMFQRMRGKTTTKMADSKSSESSDVVTNKASI